MTTSVLRKLLLVLLMLALAAYALSRFTRHQIESSTPPFLKLTSAEAKASQQVQHKIGNVSSGQTYSIEPKKNKEALYSFTVTVFGDKGSMTIRGIALQEDKEQWKVVQADTTYEEQVDVFE